MESQISAEQMETPLLDYSCRGRYDEDFILQS